MSDGITYGGALVTTVACSINRTSYAAGVTLPAVSLRTEHWLWKMGFVLSTVNIGAAKTFTFNGTTYTAGQAVPGLTDPEKIRLAKEGFIKGI